MDTAQTLPKRFISATAKRFNDDPTVRIFWICLGLHVAVWTLICTLTQPNLPLDMIEMIYWGQQWEWGYHKHPPLPAWIAATVWQLGSHSRWLMYFTSQLTIATTFWAVWQLAREGLSPWLALCAVGVLQGCYYFTFTINDINNTIVTRPMWALSILFLYRAIASESFRRQTFYWCLTGVAIGLGMLCKYYLGVLVMAMMAVPVLIPQTRRSLSTAGPYLMAVISLLIFSPHVWWMVNNDFITIEYVFKRSGQSADPSWSSHLVSPLKFVATQMGAWLPITILAWPFVAKMFRTRKAEIEDAESVSAESKLFRHFVSIVVLGPVTIYFVMALVTGANIRSMWGGPLFCCFGVLLLSLMSRGAELPNFSTQNRNEIYLTLRGCAIAAVVMMVALVCRNTLSPTLRGEYSRVHFPGEAVAAEAHRRWSELSDDTLPVIGGDMFVAGCVSAYSSQNIDVFAGMSLAANPWLTDEFVNEHGGIFVWDMAEIGEKPPVDWLLRFRNSRIDDPFVCQASGAAAGLPIHVGMIVVPPKAKANARQARNEDGKQNALR